VEELALVKFPFVTPGGNTGVVGRQKGTAGGDVEVLESTSDA
jgi:hypothetical protein